MKALKLANRQYMWKRSNSASAWFENLKLKVGLVWTVLLNLKVWLWLGFTLTKSMQVAALCPSMEVILLEFCEKLIWILIFAT